MSDTAKVKIVGLVCSAVLCGVSLWLGEREFAYAFGGLIPLILGLGPIGQGIRKLAK